jgi:hypothetical protein
MGAAEMGLSSTREILDRRSAVCRNYLRACPVEIPAADLWIVNAEYVRRRMLKIQ